jgi:hypothetical protein
MSEDAIIELTPDESQSLAGTGIPLIYDEFPESLVKEFSNSHQKDVIDSGQSALRVKSSAEKLSKLTAILEKEVQRRQEDEPSDPAISIDEIERLSEKIRSQLNEQDAYVELSI